MTSRPQPQPNKSKRNKGPNNVRGRNIPQDLCYCQTICKILEIIEAVLFKNPPPPKKKSNRAWKDAKNRMAPVILFHIKICVFTLRSTTSSHKNHESTTTTTEASTTATSTTVESLYLEEIEYRNVSQSWKIQVIYRQAFWIVMRCPLIYRNTS